ncbi:B12-binding domain-containing radical SAM protein [Vulcanisaeta thermophila]|uniref:B12-binding domain-containing radical SAM protein n=1 Tax=Vulcanisaeta thermophila TaxID=867917 RepID=UPI000A06CF45|nr:radical SAM protein [Vulcanisaeta thermophila]
MKVLLAVPPGIEKLELYRVLGLKAPPLGLAWIAAVLERAGHKVRIIDSPTEGIDLKTFINEVKAWNPDVVGLTALTPTIYKAYEAAKAIKEYDKDLPVIMGGPHVTFMYEEALSNNVDVVVRGEGEYTTLELINTMEKVGFEPEHFKQIRGLVFKLGDQVIRTPDRPPIRNLDELPWPARHLLPMDKYTLFNKPIKFIHVMASRGCPYGCTFCSTSYFWGRMIRYRSAKDVADEIEDAVNKYKTNIIVFTDDEFTLGKRFVYEFLRELDERKLDINFSCGSRVDTIDKEMMLALKSHGCTALYFGVESASQDTINRIGKKISLERAVKVFQWAKEVKIDHVGSFVLGFPWETIDDMKATVKFAIKLNPTYAQFTVATPYPGTPLYYEALSNNLIEDWNWEHYTTLRAVMRGFKFTKEQAQKMLSWAYVHYYGRLSFLIHELVHGRFGTIMSAIKNSLVPWFMEHLLRGSGE